MTPLTVPTPCLETEESTEPPPSTRCLALQSHQPCLRHQLVRHSSPVYTCTPAVYCTAKMSRSALASSACLECRRGAAGVRMGATGVRRVRERRRVIALRRMPMGVTATSGCSMTSVSRMLSRRDTGRCSEGTTIRAAEIMDVHLVFPKAVRMGMGSSPEENIFEHAQYNHSHRENFFTILRLFDDV
jgi:hypothetical protein